MNPELCGGAIGTSLVAGRSACLLRYSDDPTKVFLLTALHVVVSADASRGATISSLDFPGRALGYLRNWGNIQSAPPLDAALIWADPGRVSPEIRGIGVPRGARNAEIIVNERLRLCPATPGDAIRESFVQQSSASLSVPVSGPGWSRQVDYVDQIICSPMFSNPGDSGAAVFDDDGNIVGIVVASFSDTTFNGQPCSQTLITPIQAILSASAFSGILEVVSAVPAGAQAPPGLAPDPMASANAVPVSRGFLPPNPVASDQTLPSTAVINILGTDSLLAAGPAALANASSHTFLSAKPQFWGRYFYAPGQMNSSGRRDSHYSSAENAFLYENQIRLLPLARQTTRVTGGAVEGEIDAKLNADAIFESISITQLAATDPDILVYLDVENDTPMTAAYYEAWSETLLSYSQTQSQNKVRFRPGLYTGPEGNETWTALRTAISAGASCFGVWIARYYYGSPIPRNWSLHDETQLLTPRGGTGGLPLLAWQYWASSDDASPAFNFDLSIANPAYSDVLLAATIMPPPM